MRVLLILYLLLFSFLGNAQAIYKLEPRTQPERIGNKCLILEDKSNAFSFPGVLQETGFVAQTAEIPNYNLTQSTIWARIKFTTAHQADWYLSLLPSSYNKVTLYQNTNDKGWQEVSQGNIIDNNTRPFSINHLAFKLDLRPGDTCEVVLRIQDYYPILIDLKAGTLESFVAPMVNYGLYDGICIGIMVMMMIYNFYLFFTQRLRIYLYYTVYVLFSLLFSLNLGGYAVYYPTWLIRFLAAAPLITPAMFGAFGLLFTLELFGSVISKNLRRVIYVFLSLAILNSLFGISSYKFLSQCIMQVGGMILCVLSVTCGVVAVRKKHASAAYYLLGFGTYTASLAYIIMAGSGLLTTGEHLWHTVLTGSAIESIFLSFALGDKLKISLIEKEKAQAEALLQSQENARLVKEQNIVLERKVKERTAELAEKNKEILDSIRYASRIQRSLLPHEKYIERILKKKR